MSYYRQGPRLPSGVQFGVPRLTPWVKRIMIVCASVFVVQWFDLVVPAIDLRLEYWFGLIPELVVGGRVWQLATYMVLHGGAGHLLLNMLVLWMFGSELESTWRGRPFITYVLVCGIGGGVLATLAGLLMESGGRVTIGASGAVFGLIVAYGMVFAERTVLFMMIFPMKARTLAIVLAALAFFGLGSGGNVSHIAHLGGALTGFLYLKRAWRVGALYRELRWKLQRRRFRVMSSDDPDDRWLN